MGSFARSFVGLPWELGPVCVVDPLRTSTEACFLLRFFLFSGVPVCRLRALAVCASFLLGGREDDAVKPGKDEGSFLVFRPSELLCLF